jgi:predicted MFS family arabinose efflux permease
VSPADAAAPAAPAASPEPPAPAGGKRPPAPPLWWALLAGNFAIGSGVMVATGALNDIVRELQVSVALGGQLLSVSAVVLALGAPLLAALLGGVDRRRLLAGALVACAAGHRLAALAPDYPTLLPLRAAGVLAAAVFTPQAAAALAVMVPAADRGRAVAFIFLGWALASVAGLPLTSWIAETAGWRWAFASIALLAVPAAWAVWRTMPDGVRPPRLSLAQWGSVLRDRLLMAIVAVTACSIAGQFTLFSYFAPYYRQVLGASAAEASALFLVFGIFALAGNLVLARVIDRFGSARCVSACMAAMALAMAAWPWAGSVATVALVLVPWALGSFAANSAQQARLGAAAPALASALLALNTSAIYAGQALGAASGGALFAASGWRWLWAAALAWLLAALALSLWAQRRMRAPRGP